MKKITVVICWVFCITPTFAQSLYYVPLGFSLYAYSNRLSDSYSKINAFMQLVYKPHYIIWLEACIFNLGESNTLTHLDKFSSIDLGLAGRYQFLSRDIVGGHFFFIFQSKNECEYKISQSFGVLSSSTPHLTQKWHLTAINPGVEWVLRKYHTAIHAHAKIQLAWDDYQSQHFNDYQSQHFKWGSEITARTDIPHFHLGLLPIPHSQLTVGFYCNRYTNQPLASDLLGRIEIHLLRFVSVTIHRDQLTPISFGIKLHYGWQSNERNATGYYLTHPFDRNLTHSLYSLTGSDSSNHNFIDGNSKDTDTQGTPTTSIDDLEEFGDLQKIEPIALKDNTNE